ncbi:hypothetical protein IWX47DRAFT_850508 [Phyllosticta citricarpa]|uniref:Secreted protein n=1 Tax=Phyllosticta citricarpa TaxID=55181 RepID=A0ABR1MGY1_9PEZI
MMMMHFHFCITPAPLSSPAAVTQIIHMLFRSIHAAAPLPTTTDFVGRRRLLPSSRSTTAKHANTLQYIRTHAVHFKASGPSLPAMSHVPSHHMLWRFSPDRRSSIAG